MGRRQEIESAYDRYPDTTQFWVFVDLVSSSNYRIARGPKAGYVLGETFFALIDAVASPSPSIRTIKEIGDAVLLASDELRPLLEAVVLMRQTAWQLESIGGPDGEPFDIRMAVGFGTAKRLTRPHEDFLSTSIDKLARLMGVREQADFLIAEEAYQVGSSICAEYDSFLKLGSVQQLGGAATKGMLEEVWYRSAHIDRAKVVEFREHFVPWRDQQADR